MVSSPPEPEGKHPNTRPLLKREKGPFRRQGADAGSSRTKRRSDERRRHTRVYRKLSRPRVYSMSDSQRFTNLSPSFSKKISSVASGMLW